MSDKKVCRHCEQPKPYSDFPVNRKMKDGFDSWCKDCHREAGRISYKKHPETRRAYFESHPDKPRAYTEKYRQGHLEETRLAARLYARAHISEIAVRAKQHPDRIAFYSRRRRAIKHNAPGNGVTVQQWLDLKASYCNLCAYCGEAKPLTLDHIVPLIAGGAHDISNCVPACKSCNSKKNKASLLMFMYREAVYG